MVTAPTAAATEAEEVAKKEEEEEDVGIVRRRTHAVAVSVALPSQAAATLARHTCDPAVPPRSNWLRHDRFITCWVAQAMRQYFFLAGGATSLIWSSPNAFCKSAKARSHFSIVL
ncbi:uncharacterized protein [Miscanthus floridulus]|uniref:uncharacterized protein n=1 Tax=Miscanthus floridulus TaxID=154761 RepID=UPI00345A6036